MQPVGGQRVAQILLQLAAIFGIGMHVRRIEAVDAAAIALGRIECQVGVADQRVGCHPVLRTR